MVQAPEEEKPYSPPDLSMQDPSQVMEKTNETLRDVSSAHPSESSGTRTRKIKIRQAIKDKGVFETGVEVVEHEMEIEEGAEGQV